MHLVWIGSKVGHICKDIKGMKETEASIQRQHAIMIYYSNTNTNNFIGIKHNTMLIAIQVHVL